MFDKFAGDKFRGMLFPDCIDFPWQPIKKYDGNENKFFFTIW